MVTVAGGLPVVSGGNVVGGIGVSSGSPEQDLSVAKAGVIAFTKDPDLIQSFRSKT